VTTATPTKSASTSSQSRAGCGLWLDGLALALILAINWICYVRVINGYFLADDFLHIAYLKQVFDGDWPSLLKNFVGNWMQAEGTTFYRPLISLTLAFDYFFFGANASGFHLSNLFFQTASSLLLYLVVTEIGRIFIAPAVSASETTASSNSQTKTPDLARLQALAAALFFSASPLHCEVVAWIIARVDSVACMFYLAALQLYLLSRRKSGRPAKICFGFSLAFFALSLCSKEMAVTLPPTIMLLLLVTESSPGEKGLRLKFFGALKKSLPYWAMLIAYLSLRTLALGTISGGYQGSIGEGLSGSLAKRWLFDGSFWRVLFPLNLDVFGNGHGLFKSLRVLYILAAVNFAAALLLAQKRAPAVRSCIFGLGWLLFTLVPTYQVWNLTETLQGSRFAYFGTMPIAYLLALAVLPPVVTGSKIINRLFLPLRLTLLTFFVIVFATITSKNNQPWYRAMQELKAFQSALCSLAQANPGRNCLVLNIPQSYRGAHMLYNGATMSVMLRPPLAGKDIADQIYTFEPATFGDADLVSISRLRHLLPKGGVATSGSDTGAETSEDMNVAENGAAAVNERAEAGATESGSAGPTKGAATDAGAAVTQENSDTTGHNKQGYLYFWDRKKLHLEPLSFANAGAANGSAQLSKVLFDCQAKAANTAVLVLRPDTVALSPAIDLPASEIDAIEVSLTEASLRKLQEMKDKEVAKTAVLCLSYSGGRMAMPILDNGHEHPLIFQLSEHKNWLMQGVVHELAFKTIGCPEAIEIASIRAINLENQMPNIEPDAHDLVEGPDGICRVKGPRPTFSYDVSNVPGAVSATCEVSRPNSWFEHYSGTLRENDVSKNAFAVTPFNKVKGRNILLSYAGIKDHGFYQIKVAAVDKNGKVIGYFSDPLNFQI
jgi:hypothetical protein